MTRSSFSPPPPSHFSPLVSPSHGLPAAAQSRIAALEHARQLLKSTPLIDGHNDLPWEIRESKTAPRDVAAYDLRAQTPGHTDLARMGEGEVGAQFWSIYIPGEIKDSGYARVQLEQFDIARRMIARYPDRLALALSADDIERDFKRGRVASLLGMEGGHAIENSLGALRAYYELGARYMTLTHNVTLDWADAALDSARHDGLTEFGREVVREMNRLGMLVDLSHVSPATMSDALDVTEAPVIFSHSSARALVDHPAERARFHPGAAAKERGRGDGHLRPRFRVTRGGGLGRPGPGALEPAQGQRQRHGRAESGCDEWKASPPAAPRPR